MTGYITEEEQIKKNIKDLLSYMDNADNWSPIKVDANRKGRAIFRCKTAY